MDGGRWGKAGRAALVMPALRELLVIGPGGDEDIGVAALVQAAVAHEQAARELWQPGEQRRLPVEEVPEQGDRVRAAALLDLKRGSATARA